jgi:hypothetical protein
MSEACGNLRDGATEFEKLCGVEMPELVWGHSQAFGWWLSETGREPPHR